MINWHCTCQTYIISNYFIPLNINIMSSLLYLIAIILVIGWIFGAFVYSVGGIIHILLVLAVIAILFRIIGGSRV